MSIQGMSIMDHCDVYGSVDKYSEKQLRSVNRIMSSLDKNESRLSTHYNTMRSHERKRGKSVLLIRIPRQGSEPASFNVFMLDISSGGTSFVYPGEIAKRTIFVGIPIAGKEPTWFEGEVVRCKEIIGEGFWEYGIKFKQRIE